MSEDKFMDYFSDNLEEINSDRLITIIYLAQKELEKRFLAYEEQFEMNII